MRNTLTPKEKLALIARVADDGVSVTQACKEFGVSRFTFYKWFNRYQKAKDKLEALASQRPTKNAHWHTTEDNESQQIINYALRHPRVSVNKIDKSLPVIGRTAIQRVLQRNGLSTKEERELFSHQVKAGAVEYPLSSRTKIQFLLEGFPPLPPFFDNRRLIHFGKTAVPFFFIFSLGYLCCRALFSWGRMVFLTPGVSPLGLVFATISLLVGGIFFLYSAKTYLSLALVLSTSRRQTGLGNGLSLNGQEGKQSRLHSIFTNFLQASREKQGEERVRERRGVFSWLFGKELEDAGVPGSVLINGEISQLELERKPFVSIHLPMFNEKRVARRIIEACAKMEYFDENGRPNFEVLVCDDSSDETVDIVRQVAEGINLKLKVKSEKLKLEIQKCSRYKGSINGQVSKVNGQLVRILHRPTREGFKGGALKHAIEKMDPRTEFIMVFDADFVPFPDTISQFLKHYQFICRGLSRTAIRKSKVGAITGYQWHVLNKDENWITKGVRTEYSGSYLVERPARELVGGLKIIHGSVYMARAEVLKNIGWGTSITEDFEMTLKLYEKGYKVVFTPYVQAPAECVSTLKRLSRQRMRWAEGHSNNIRRMFKRLIRSPRLSFMEKLELLYLSPYYLQAALFLVGNICWLIAELVFRVKLPFWTSLWGWSMVLSNLFALPLMNSVGLFVEESKKDDYLGILSFIALCYLVVPFQAYASVKGFLEKEEGTWFRTPKSGKVTISLIRSRFSRLVKIFFPLEGKTSEEIVSPELEPLALSPSALNRLGNLAVLPLRSTLRNRRRVGRVVLASMLIMSTMLWSLAPIIPYSPKTVNASPFGMLLEPGYQSAPGEVKAEETEAENRVIEDIEAGDWKVEDRKTEDRGTEAGEKTIENIESEDEEVQSQGVVAKFISRLFAWLRGILAPRSCDSCRGEGGNSAITGFLSSLRSSIYAALQNFRHWLAALPSFFWNLALAIGEKSQFLREQLSLFEGLADEDSLESGSEVAGYQKTLKKDFQAREIPELIFHFPENKKPSEGLIDSLLKRLLGSVRASSLEEQASSPEEYEAYLYDYMGKELNVNLELSQIDNQSVKVIVPPSARLKPGAYVVKVELTQDGEIYTQEQDFTWGVLAININKSIYLPGETAKLAMAVLDEKGEMVCDALLRLEVKASQGKPSIFTTEDGTIRINPECYQKAFTLNPDYEAEYQLGEAGEYEMVLTAETENGTYTIYDSFEVRESMPFEIERTSATRIFPVEAYPMQITIRANEDFSGFIEETVPASFDIQSAGESLLLQETIEGNQPNSGEPQPQRFLGIQTKQDSTEIIKGDDSQKIRWQVDWRAGNIYQLSYFFNAPDQSPAAFTVGPLRLLLAGSDRVVFIESRVWQLAIDAVETRYMRGVASEVTVNGLTTYSLGTSQSTTAQSSLITTGSQNGRENQTVDWGIRVYTRTSVPAENEVTLGTPVAQVQRTYLGGNTEGIQSNTWACPQTAVNATDSVVVRVFAQIPGYVAWTQQAQFTTEQLGASQLDSATWTVYYYTKYYTFTGVPSASRRTEGTFYWGTTTPYNSRITNFSWTEPTTTVSGIVYLDNESTIATSGNGGPCDGTTIIGIRVNGGSETTTTCDGSTAAYSISVGTITSGDTVTAYLTSTDKANTVYVSDGGGTDTGINLFLETVIVRDEPDGTITIPDTWDWDESTESPATNMLFDAVSGSPNTLTVETGKELHVWTGDIFDPGGTVTTQGSTGHLHVDSTASAYLDTASNAIGGNAIIDGTRLDFDTTTTVTGDVTVAAGATANFDANTTINGGDITVAGSGIVASSAGTVTMGADGTIGGGTGTFNLTNLTISGSGTETILGAADSSTINVSGDVDIGVGAEIAMNDKFLDVNGGSVTTTGFGSMITCTGCTAGGLTLAGTGTLGGSEDDIVGVYNLTLDGSTATTTVSSEIDVMNNLVVGSGRTLSMGSNSLSVGRSTVTNSGSIDISGTLTQSSSGITSIASSSGGAATIGGTGSITFYNLFFTPAATSTFTLGSAASQTINVLGQMRIGNGSNGVIVTAASNNPTLDVDGEFEINNAATFIASETGTFNVAGNWDNNGTFTHSSGEVTLNASSGSPKNIDSTGAADDDFFDLTLNDGGGPVTWELGSNLDVDGTLHIAGGTLDVTATDYQVNVAGDWDNDEGTGGFTAQDGTVVLDGAAESIQAVTGATNFYSLTATTGDRIIEFGANETFGWSGTLTFQGTDCDDMLVLRSSAFDDHAATSKWTLTNSGSTGTLQYLDVQDSTVSGSAISASYSVASGGNTNWTIAADDCVGASTTNANATGYSFQRKTFYDEENERYWLFYHDGDEIQIRWSSDHGANWNATNTDANGYRPYSTNDFSVWWKTISEVEYVWLAVNDGGDIKVIAGTLSSNDISWDNDVSTALNESGTYSYPYITLDSDDYVWVGANYNEGSNYVYKTATTYEGAASQKGTTDLSTWNWTAAPHQISDDQGDENVYGNIVALSSPTQDMYATFVVNNAIEGCTWDFSDTAWEDADGASCTGGGAGGTSVTIEQQINIIDQVYTSTTTETFLPTDNSLGLILWDGTKYNGASVYFEAIIRCVGCTG
ncbi:glycosyltransferase, partial [Patescibacteria group bacterium]|nr:glycosyltransferase [Patescibacteria group bacterium]